MERTLTVRGTGALSLKPDTIEVSIDLSSKNKEYTAAMELASKKISALSEALEKAGFEKEGLKTGYLNVRADYEGYNDEHGNYRQRFIGYVCEQNMTLRFPFDTSRLTKVLASISACEVEPNLNIAFTVRDKDAAIDTLLKAAAKDALRRAKVLAKAAGAKLGPIVSIDHNVQNPTFYSPTRVNASAKMARFEEDACFDMGVAPENIELSENAGFVWSLED